MTLPENCSPPPPTSNTLTPTQRACLRRSATKLGRVLGVTPRVLDVDDSDAKCTLHTGSVPPYHQSPKSPVDIRSEGQHLSSTFTPHDFHTNECHRNKGTLLMENGESSTPMHQPPLIRVARPVCPQHVSKPNHTSPDTYSSPESADSDDDAIEPCASTPESVNSVRRKKMERLYRTLGEEVPVSIVFPESRSDDSGYDSDTGHWQGSAVNKRPSSTVRAPCHSSPLPTPVKLQTGQTPLSAAVASSPPRPAKPGHISARDFRVISSPIPHKVSPNGSPSHRPHYRLRSPRRLTSDDDGMQPGSQMKRIDNPVLGGLDVRSLRTISESSKEADSLSRKEEKEIRANVSLSSSASHLSLRSEWYPSDEESDDANTEETLVEKKGAPPVLDVTQGVSKKVWSHKRKPPPVYEP